MEPRASEHGQSREGGQAAWAAIRCGLRAKSQTPLTCRERRGFEMGNPAYDARREAERAKAETDKAAQEAAKVAFEGITAFFNGKAWLYMSPCNDGTMIRFERET